MWEIKCTRITYATSTSGTPFPWTSLDATSPSHDGQPGTRGEERALMVSFPRRPLSQDPCKYCYFISSEKSSVKLAKDVNQVVVFWVRLAGADLLEQYCNTWFESVCVCACVYICVYPYVYNHAKRKGMQNFYQWLAEDILVLLLEIEVWRKICYFLGCIWKTRVQIYHASHIINIDNWFNCIVVDWINCC